MLLALKEWESKSSLLSQAAGFSDALIVGGAIESPSSFYSCSIDGVDVSIFSNQKTKFVSCLYVENEKKLFIGHDLFFTVIDLNSKKIAYEKDLDGVFYEFLFADDGKKIIAVHELGVLALSASGNFLWSISATDILDDWRMVDDALQLRSMDGNSLLININTGCLVAAP